MQADLSESVQQSIRPGSMVDTFYYGDTNLQKQAYPCVTNTRFVQQFTNLGAGSSQFVISPNQGVSDIVIELQMGNLVGANTGLALPNGWGYSLVNRVSVRYGSSAQYFWSGQQMLLENLYDCETGTKRDEVLSLGGNFTVGAAISGARAYLYLKLPHNSVRAEGKPLPFPSDLLVQPIVITVELFSPATAFYVGTGGSLASAPAQLASAQLQVKQEVMSDSADLLARRVDMNSHAYTFPLMYFAQQEVQVRCPGGGAQSVNLTGFRAGEVRSVLLWLTKDTDTPQYLWYPITNAVLTYNGEIFSRFDNNSSQLWALTGDSKSALVNTTQVAADLSVAARQNTWVELPFAQINAAYDRELKLVHGKPILNAVVQLTFNCPDTANYTLHAMYVYNASLLCSRGSSEYIF
jgi:hypothetical protein